MDDRRMPIEGGPSLPWAMLEPHERQAIENHDQPLAALASRGGLSCCEALAILDDQSYRKRTFYADSRAELVRRLAAWDDNELRRQLAAALARAEAAERERDQAREPVPACENCGSTERVRNFGRAVLCVEPGPCMARVHAKIDAARKPAASVEGVVVRMGDADTVVNSGLTGDMLIYRWPGADVGQRVRVEVHVVEEKDNG